MSIQVPAIIFMQFKTIRMHAILILLLLTLVTVGAAVSLFRVSKYQCLKVLIAIIRKQFMQLASCI